MDISQCDWSSGPVHTDIRWPIDEWQAESPNKLADLYQQPRQFVSASSLKRTPRVETNTDGGLRRCREVIETVETMRLADVYCVRIFGCAHWDRRVRRLGASLSLIGAVALGGAFAGLGLHAFAQGTADLIGGLGGGASVGFGGGLGLLSPRPRARRKRELGRDVHTQFVKPAQSHEIAANSAGPWRRCVSDDGRHTRCATR